ncbi:MAG: hypothetical protein KKF62_04145 [Bacteroidetes bacterium]|nr:hypothetical protein [Bacteroidota bacterium]MBU1116365.1 hypothetical protein [Bacteroidota bacterium]MBU1800389.1 hypothetical protein [Bacteroidota bacterium]
MIFTKRLSKQNRREISIAFFIYLTFTIIFLPLHLKFNESKNPLDFNYPNNATILSSIEFIISPKLIDRNFERLLSGEKELQNYSLNYFLLYADSSTISYLFVFPITTHPINEFANYYSHSNPRSPPIFL